MLNKIASISGARALGLATLLAVFTVPAAFGADLVKADVPFAFQVGKKTLPAGKYDITINRNDEAVEVMSATKVKGAAALEPIVTTLAASSHSTATDAHLVFDKLGNTYTLSEVWLPDQDGVLVHTTKGKHEHHVVHVKR